MLLTAVRWRPRAALARARFLGILPAAFVVFATESTIVQAQAPSSAAALDTVPLRLGAVFNAVAERNPKIAAARSLASAVQARIPAAGTLPDPELQLGFMNYQLPALRPMDPLGMVQLQVMQMLPLGGKLPLSSRIAAHQAAAQRERAADVAWETRTRSAMAFYELYAAEAGAGVALETRRLVQDVAEIARSMYQVGEGNQSDVLRAQLEVARMTEEVERMSAMRSAAAARLNALMDLAADGPIAAAALPSFPDDMPVIDSLVIVALRNRPMIRAGEEEIAAAEAMSVRARRELVPDVVVGVQYGHRSTPMGAERMGSLMLGTSVPLQSGRRQLKWRDEADAMRAMSQAELAWMKADTRGRIGEALAMLNRARRLADLYASTVLPQAEAAVSASIAAYRVGRVDFMNVLDSRMTVNRYRQELVTLRVDEGTAWAELEMLVGRELFDPWSVGSTRGKGND